MRPVHRASVLMLCSLPLMLGACSGSASEESPPAPASAESSEGSVPSRDVMFEALREEASGSGAPAEALDCVLAKMDALSDDELFGILEDTADAAVEAKVEAYYQECVPAES